MNIKELIDKHKIGIVGRTLRRGVGSYALQMSAKAPLLEMARYAALISGGEDDHGLDSAGYWAEFESSVGDWIKSETTRKLVYECAWRCHSRLEELLGCMTIPENRDDLKWLLEYVRGELPDISKLEEVL